MNESPPASTASTSPSAISTASYKDSLALLERESYDLVIYQAEFRRQNEFDRLARLADRARGAPVVAAGVPPRSVDRFSEEAAAERAVSHGAVEYLPFYEITRASLERIQRYAAHLSHQRTAARLADERYRIVASAIPDGITMTDMECLIIFASPQTAALHGYARPEELIGKSAFDLIHPEDLPAARKDFEEMLSGHPRQTAEYRLARADGSYFQGELNIAPVQYGQGEETGFIAVTRDITRRVQVEQSYRTLVEETLQELLILQDGRVVFANPAALHNSGYTQAELLAKSADEVLQMIHPDDRQAVNQAALDRLAGRPAPERQQFRVFRKDGSLRWIESTESVVMLPGGPAIQSAQLDISERRQAEERLRQRIAIEDLIAGLSSRFINMPIGEVDEQIRVALHSIAIFTGFDCVDLVWLDGDRQTPRQSYEWRSDRLPPSAGEDGCLSLPALPWLHSRLLQLEPVQFNRASQLPAEAAAEKALFASEGQGSVLVIPVAVQDSLAGYLGLASGDPGLELTREDARLMGLVGDVFINVLTRRQVEEALRQSEAQYRMLADSISDIVALHEPSGRVLYVSPSAERLIGRSLDQIQVENPLEYIHPDDLQGMMTHLKDAVQNGEPGLVQWRCLLPDGSYIWLETKLEPVAGSDSAGRRFISASRDVTTRRKTEEALRQAKQDRDQVISAITDALWSADTFAGGLNYRYISPVIEKITGRPYTFYSGLMRRPYEIIDPDDLPWVRHIMEQVDCGQQDSVEIEYRIVHPDGSIRWVRDSETGRVLRDGSTRIDGVLSDITERKQAEADLQQAHEELQRITSSVSDYLWSGELDASGELNIRYISPVVEKITGYPPAYFLAEPGQAWRRVIYPADLASYHRALQALGRERLEYEIEYRLVRSDGAVRWLRDSMLAVETGPGCFQVSGIANDITARRQAEEALQQANEQLRQTIRELEERNEQITLLNEMGDLLQSCARVADVFDVVAAYGQRLFPGHSGSVFMLDNTKRLAESAAAWGEGIHSELIFEPEACWALRRGRTHLVDPHTGELRCSHVRSGGDLHSSCIPMMAQGDTLGMFYIEAAGFDGEDPSRQTASLVAERLSLVIANLRLRESLQSQSIRDSLTGLYNRRYMDEVIERELRQAARQKRLVGFVMMDIDHFKQFNDQFGHAAGDMLLEEYAAFLMANVRAGDIVCRYGGDEFILILPDATLEDVITRADLLRQRLKSLLLYHHGQALGSASSSMGVAAYPDHGEDLESLLRAADKALYAAKASGRDRLELAREQTSPPPPPVPTL